MTQLVNEQYFKKILNKLVDKRDLSIKDSHYVFSSILNQNVTNEQIAAFLMGLTTKGESISEIDILISEIKRISTNITPRIGGKLIDTCGTGGGVLKTFNISSATAVVAASAGCIIAKHGNKTMSGICGSADFFEYIGFDLKSTPERIKTTIEKIGLGFLYAPIFHPSLKNISQIRRLLGIKTIFNIAGPLCNPCTNLSGQLIGVYNKEMMNKISKVMQKRKINTIIVHSEDGVDELSNTGKNSLIICDGNGQKRMHVNPPEVGLKKTDKHNLIVKTKEESVKQTLKVIYGQASRDLEDIVVLNSAAVLILAGIVSNFKDGIEISRNVIKNGKSTKKMEDLIRCLGDKETLDNVNKKFGLI